MEITAAVVGAGRQGLCAALDLARLPGVRAVRLVDRSIERLEHAELRWGGAAVNVDLEKIALSTEGEGGLGDALEGVKAVISAVPFQFGPAVCAAAIDAGAHVVDLGGNLDVSREIHAMGARAAAHSCVVAPDCGLMPGLGNTLAGAAIEQLESQGARNCSVDIRCGGLPRVPKNALGYELVFSLDGLVNEYDGESVVLRDGKIARDPTLEDIDEWTHARLGKLECATTSGGTSTAPETFAGRVANYRYTTVRYPGHFAFFQMLKKLGLLTQARREDLKRILTPILETEAPDDLVLLHVEVTAPSGESASREILDFRDAETGFTAMERMTAFPAVAVLELALEGRLRPGSIRVERDLPFREYLTRLTRRGIGGLAAK